MEQESLPVTQYDDDLARRLPHDDSSSHNSFDALVAYDSDLKDSGSSFADLTEWDRRHFPAGNALTELDTSLTSTDLDLETRIFGKQLQKDTHPRKSDDQGVKDLAVSKKTANKSTISRPKSLKAKSGDRARCFLHMGDADPEDHVFHPEIVPFEPSKTPAKPSSNDPHYLLDANISTSKVRSDPNTARYLRILKPQRDSSETGEGVASESSLNLFESLNISAAEKLLLESPTDSPGHFKQAQLRLDTLDSEAEGSFVYQERVSVSSPVLQETPQPKKHPGEKPSEEIRAEIFDLEAELKRLVLEIYSDKEPDFAPLPGAIYKMETLPKQKVSQARTELEKAFGGGDDYMDNYQKPQRPPPQMSLDAFNTLASTSDALALQRSVISNSTTKPASMEEIQAVLAAVQQQQKDASMTSMDSPLKPLDTSNSGYNGLTPDRQYNSMSSLDETPSKIPANYVDEMATPAEVNGIDPPDGPAFNDSTREDNSIPHTGNTGHSQMEETQELQNKKIVTVKKRPNSLLGQNTTLAINNAVAHKYRVPPTDEVTSPTSNTVPRETTLFRSPVQAITTSKGGKIAAMEGLEKQKPKKKKGKRSGKTSAANTKLVSDTDTEPPSDTELATRNKEVVTTVKAAGENEYEVSQMAMEDPPGFVKTKDNSDATSAFDASQSENDGAPPNSEQGEITDSFNQETPGHPSSTSSPAPTNTAVASPSPAPAPAPVEEPTRGSFLGSLFPWGRRSEKPPTSGQGDSSITDTSTNQDASRERTKSDSTHPGESVNSGVDFIPGLNGDAGSPPSHLTNRPPLSSSTPNNVIRLGRTEEIIPQRDTPQYSHPTPTTESLQQAAISTATRPTHRPTDYGKLRSTPLPRTSTHQSSRYPSALDGLDQGEEDLQTVLREKAKLEGQLEMLLAETESALQARTQLQSQVAILQAKLKAQGSGGDGGSNRVALEADILALKENRNHLEQVISDLQVGLEAKELALQGMRHELAAAETTNQRLQARLEEVRKEIGQHEDSVAQLKKRMASMQEETDRAKQNEAQSAGQVASLQTDVESLTKAKDWFQEQLHFAQEVRNQLQSELSASQTKTAAQAAMIETLKTENTKVKQSLTGARQQALQEKEQIAKHLETIEADIVTREATFSAMQREKTAVQQAVFAQMDQMEEEKFRLAGLVASASELERQLDVARQEMSDKHAALVALEAEKRDLVKGLTLAEEALAARETEMEALQTKCNNMEQQLREEQGKSTDQDSEVHQLKAEKASLEAALVTANEEKRAFDESLQKLRGDMGRVETGFKQMRQELAAKSSQLETAQMEGKQLQEELREAEKQVEGQQQNLEASITAIGNKDTMIDELLAAKEQLEKEIAALKRDVHAAKNSYGESMQANSGLQGELLKAREGFQMLEQQLQGALSENANLHGQLESLSEDHQQLSGLMEENAALRQRVADAQSTMHRDLAEQKANVLRLGTDLSTTQKELKEKERMYEANIATLSRQLEEATEARERTERELNSRTAAAAQMSKEEQEKLFSELQTVQQDAEVVRAERGRLNDEVNQLRRNMEEDTDAYKRRIEDLEAELQELKDILQEQKRKDANSRSLALDLERERGRLAGVHQSHSALKQHTGMLESALAQRETAVEELSAQLSSSAQERANENLRLRQQLQEMDGVLRKEKQAMKELRKQLADEKGESNRVRQELQTLGAETQEVKGDMERKDHQLETLNAELTKLKKNEAGQKTELDAMRKEMEATRAHMERLKRHLQDREAQSPVLEDQMKTLAWQSEQKAREADALKEQLELADKRQQIELDGVKSTLKMTNQELEGLKKELATTRKEKFAFQAKLSQLKSALQATLQQNKLLKAKLKSKSRVAATLGKQGAAAGAGGTQADSKGLAEEIVVPEIAYDVEALLNSDEVEGVSASHSRPLYAIQSCLQSIKDQMGALEDQMMEHTAAVNTSSEAWKEVSNRVRDLRNTCNDPINPPQGAAQRPRPLASSKGSGPGATPSPAPSKAAIVSTPAGLSLANGQPTRSSKTSPKVPQVYDL